MSTFDRPSPYGADQQTPRRIVVHAMAEYLRLDEPIHAVDFLARIKLSVHAIVTPNGDVIRCRTDEQGAYHALNHNTDSLGVEVLVPGEHDYRGFLAAIRTDYVSSVAWEATIDLVRGWMAAWSIPIDRVVRHSDLDPERKQDPGTGFDWGSFLGRLDAR